MTNPAAPPLPPEAVMIQLATSHWVARCIHVVAKLGVADQLKAGPKSAEDLAKAVGADASSLHRVLRALASIGVFEQGKDRRYALTPLGDTLRTDAPGSARPFAVYMAEPWHWNAYAELLHSVRTGQSAFPKVHGLPVFEWLERHPDASKTFNDAMVGFTQTTGVAVLDAYDFAGIGTLVDVGGGVGHLLAAILAKYPKMKGVSFDLPSVNEEARKALAAAGLAKRATAEGGSFFEAVPAGDAHLLKHILHDWDDGRCLAVLRSCRKAVAAGGRLLVVEMVLPSDDSPSFGKVLDIEMLAVTEGGRERTEEEYRRLFASAGYELTRVIPTQSPVFVLVGTPR